MKVIGGHVSEAGLVQDNKIGDFEAKKIRNGQYKITYTHLHANASPVITATASFVPEGTHYVAVIRSVSRYEAVIDTINLHHSKGSTGTHNQADNAFQFLAVWS